MSFRFTVLAKAATAVLRWFNTRRVGHNRPTPALPFIPFSRLPAPFRLAGVRRRTRQLLTLLPTCEGVPAWLPRTNQSPQRQLHLNAFLMSTGHHEASWRLPESDPHAGSRVEHYQQLARTAERGKLDSIFLADVLLTFRLTGESFRMVRLPTEHPRSP